MKMPRRAILAAVFLTAVFLTGCGSPDSGSHTGAAAGTEGTTDDSVAMGRYMESVSEVDAGELMDLVKLSDGRLALLENGAVGRMVSADNGVTWEEDILPDWDELREGDKYIVDMKASSDGSVAILFRCYNLSAAEEQTDEGEQDEAAEEQTDEGEQGEAAEEQTDEGEQDEEVHVIDEKFRKWVSRIYLISPEGEGQWITMSLAEDGELTKVCFSEDGSRLFAASYDEKIYEIDRETGTGKMLMTVDIIPDMFCVWENYIALKNETEGVYLYDTDTKERIMDDVLSDFISQNCKGRKDIYVSTYSIFPAEEGGIYLICGKGVYRHVIGGTVMEQVINGGLSSLGDSTKHISKMIRTEEKGFVAAFSEGKISAFTYDPNISTIPSQMITAYSLTESTLLRQAIIRYQGKNPDVYVEYKVGMDEEGGITREDAIKKLNTEIMAGKGPDFLLLDGLPTDSYIDKGVLADISPYLDELEKEEKLLSNIRESFTKDGKTYMIPAAVTLPVYMADKQYMTNVSDLSTLADMFEKLRRTYPGEEIMEAYNDTVLLDVLMPVSEPLWLTQDQQFDTKAVSEYLEQTKRIYDACMEGLSEEVLEKYRAREAGESWIVNSDEFTAYNDLQGGAMQIASGNVRVSMGNLNNVFNYALLHSVRRIKNGENCQILLIPGAVKDSFCPIALMGISAVSTKADLAGGFMQEILSREMQSMIYPEGFPVNEEGLSEYMKSVGGMLTEEMQASGQEDVGGYGFTGENGELAILDINRQTEQEERELCETLASVHTPYLADPVMEDAVRAAGKEYLNGGCSLEEAVEAIQKKMEIYMAE